ncbi:hypothetical protein N3K66_005760 [Trichothecium roseum]|uniref:Uncharacterized protein n=1 Tax=Trichothecium roseum TaxID=47278 RepID=A0ACC0V060_9HYPO|nr:hypothetical protein N3K66_005760 [Trichothecium roseum]
MKCKDVDKLVYEYMFPKPRPSDPPNFSALLVRCIIPEVREETQSFYGHISTQEARYPGLDYTHPTHRIRLSRWPWHRRMFRAIDGLGLTASEVDRLSRWEGTKWAKDKYEKENNVVIRDTAADGIPEWVEDEGRAVSADVPRDPEPWRTVGRASEWAVHLDDDEDMEEEDLEMSDQEPDIEDDHILLSIGHDLNARLRAGAALREQGDPQAVLDNEWETWLKNALESGELAHIADTLVRYNSHPTTTNLPRVPATLFPANMLGAARRGNWVEIPEVLHPILRQTLRDERITQQQQQQQGRRTYGDLRLPGTDSGHNIAEA